MTRDDSIRLALEAGFDVNDHGEWVGDKDGKCLERFANFVAAAEREACAKVCDLEFAACWHADAILQAKEAKRCADAIRERGKS